jgi:hypothetical protein
MTVWLRSISTPTIDLLAARKSDKADYRETSLMRFLLLLLTFVILTVGASPSLAEPAVNAGHAKVQAVTVTSTVDPLWHGWLIRTYVDEDVSLSDADLHMQLEAARLMLDEGETHFVVVERRGALHWSYESATERPRRRRTAGCGRSSCGRWGRTPERNPRDRRSGRGLTQRGRGVGAYVIAVPPEDPDAQSVAETIERLEAELEA